MDNWIGIVSIKQMAGCIIEEVEVGAEVRMHAIGREPKYDNDQEGECQPPPIRHCLPDPGVKRIGALY
jgi:hypothetical protein